MAPGWKRAQRRELAAGIPLAASSCRRARPLRLAELGENEENPGRRHIRPARYGESTGLGARLLTPGTTHGFNPQPEPPGIGVKLLTPGTTHGFNPQPEPPGIGARLPTPGIAPGVQSAPATQTIEAPR